jgi:hypothetical protein
VRNEHHKDVETSIGDDPQLQKISATDVNLSLTPSESLGKSLDGYRKETTPVRDKRELPGSMQATQSDIRSLLSFWMCQGADFSRIQELGANADDQPCARADHLGVGAAPQTVRPQNAFWMHGSPTTKSSGSAKLSRLCSGGICSQVA